MADRFYVLAERHDHARYWARALGLHPTDWVYISTQEPRTFKRQLDGIDRPRVVVYPTAPRGEHWPEIRDYALARRARFGTVVRNTQGEIEWREGLPT